MATQAEPQIEPRIPLSRERVLHGAVELADRDGIEALTMRNLAHELGVEAMSLYYHVANKEEVLDGITDLIAAEINDEVDGLEAPADPDEWKTAVRNRVLTARQVMLRHPWAPGVFESRVNMSPQVVVYYNALLGLLRGGGFSYDTAHHAMHAFGSRALGFTQELFDPSDQPEGDEAANEMLEKMATQLPYLVEMISEVAHDDADSTLGWCDDQTEFEFGLDLILDGLDRMRE
ncbi:MAG: TetR/AcrR family transcriptional regulator C-terminal domain-containing protein [Acidimicrobiia bacterium]|jgi:AcrR family transcriptional regulator